MKFIIPTIYRYVRVQKVLNDIVREEHLQENLSNLFGVHFEKDWINRLWVVLNPYVQDINDITNIYQYNKDGSMTNDLAMEKWIMDNMNIAKEFIINNGLFDILSYRLEKIDNDKNYLFVLQNIYWDDLKSVLKRLCWIVGGLVVVGVALLIIL